MSHQNPPGHCQNVRLSFILCLVLKRFEKMCGEKIERKNKRKEKVKENKRNIFIYFSQTHFIYL